VSRSNLMRIFVSVATLLVLSCAAGGGEHLVKDKVTAAEATTIAKEAYIFHYPLVMYYRTMYLQAIDPSSGVGFGKWLHLGTSSPKDTDIVTPNNDSPYSYAWLDLRAEPWVLTMPKIEADRFYTSQWNDLWGFVLENLGSVYDGNDGVNIMFASPTWLGNTPAGIKRVVRGDSDFLGTLTRTQLKAPEDLANVKKIQNEYKLQPLSALLGKPAPPARPKIDWMPWEDGAENTEAFWNYANFLLQFTTPNPQDAPWQDRAAEIGIAAGQKWDPNALDADIRQAISAGMKDALADLDAAGANITDPSLYFRTRKDLDQDYFNRAVGVRVGIFGNWKSISAYYALLKDEKGNPLDGSQEYVVRMTKDQVPPVKFFWSFTMYNLPQRFLVDNPIDRYSIGSATPGLNRESDGSLTIYISKNSPGKDKESNWLPAPDGPFWIVLRTYGPDESILHNTWKVPQILAND